MIRTATVVSLLAASALSAYAIGDVVVIEPDRDATLIQSDSGDLANGSGRYVFSGNTEQGPDDRTRRGLFSFDVAGAVPASATINSVTLTVYVSKASEPDAETVRLHRVTEDWNEGPSNPGGGEGSGTGAEPGDVTWVHTFYDTQTWANVGGTFLGAHSATTSIGAQDLYYSWSSVEMAADVQGWLDSPASNNGWIVIGNESGVRTAKRFDSSESNASDQRPKLSIDFTIDVPTGACCLPDGSCIAVEAEAICTGLTGVFQGFDTDCGGVVCEQPTGACCLPGGVCDELTFDDCTAMGGTYQGDDVVCETDLCPLFLPPYVDPLPIPATAVPVDGEPGGEASYEIAMTQFEQQFHTNLPPTTAWGYDGGTPGPVIEAGSGLPVTVTWINDLRDAAGELRVDHYLPVDLCPHGPDHEGDTPRTVVHLHGGHVPAGVDGYPELTFLPGEQVTYEYPNGQDAATLWFHDHALGITRLNVYMGMAGLYLLRDANELGLNLPDGDSEIPLVIQDRSFESDGSLVYPAVWQDHFFGEFIMVNGKVWPYLDVSRSKYRFRVLNGSGSRTYTLTLEPVSSFFIIGNDGGLLDEPIEVGSFTLSPGERVDVVVDFEQYPNGTEVLLVNSAVAPFPNGATSSVVPQVMKFNVQGGGGFTDPLPTTLRVNEILDEADSVATRDFELRKDPDSAPSCGDPWWLINGLTWDDITEYPEVGSTEIWRFINRSGQTHPMHMHLVFFQVLDRQMFEVVDDEIVPIGDPTPPGPSESGWKDTVQVGPSEIVRVIARFDDYEGKYSYHCHILEHEDHEMMRQFQTLIPCHQDANRSGTVEVDDLLAVLGQWGPCPDPCSTIGEIQDPDTCMGDVNRDCVVNVNDLLTILGGWGPCP